MSEKGLLLVNLGTPKSPHLKDVRSYLKEFLMDPLVMDLPWLARVFLVHSVIVPMRCKTTAKAYEKVWTAEGSPLLKESQGFSDKLQKLLGARFKVKLAMRYGSPSIAAGLDELNKAGVHELFVLPLFPQYAQASSGSALLEVKSQMAKQKLNWPCRWGRAFYKTPFYIRALAQHVNHALTDFKPDVLLTSYHGLPVRQVKKSGCTRVCQNEICPPDNHECYRAQCFYTTELLKPLLNLPAKNISLAFQSRLGGTAWILPELTQEVVRLRALGVRRLSVTCPSFVADCLENLEEVGLRLKEQWLKLGGVDFQLITSLNSHLFWVQAVADNLSEPTLFE